MISPQLSILIVDDQPDDLSTLSAMLTSEGYNVSKVLDGKTALKFVRTFLPDLILLDIVMPQMNGYEVCSALKAAEETCEIPIIFLSVLEDIADKTKAFTIGGLDYINKPFQPEEVLLRISHQLNIYRQRQGLIQQSHCLQQEVQERQRAEGIVQQQLQQEQLLSAITAQIHQSLQLDEILNSTVEEVRQPLQSDRVLILRFLPDWSGEVVAESVSAERFSLLGQSINDPRFQTHWQHCYQDGCVSMIENSHTSTTSREYLELLSHYQVNSSLAIPIIQNGSYWGVLAIHQCSKPQIWDPWTLSFLQHVTDQLAIALHQSHLYQTAQQQVAELQTLKQLKNDFLGAISHELRSPSLISK